MYMNTMRSGGSVKRLASGAPLAIVSSQGSAIAAPAPFKTVLREIFLVMLKTPSSSYPRSSAALWGGRPRPRGTPSSRIRAKLGGSPHHFTTIGKVRLGGGGGKVSIATCPP